MIIQLWFLDGDGAGILVELFSIVLLSELDNIFGSFYLRYYVFNTKQGSQFRNDSNFLQFEFSRLEVWTSWVWVSILLTIHGLNNLFAGIGGYLSYSYGIIETFGSIYGFPVI